MKKYLLILAVFTACTKSNTAPETTQRVDATSASISKIKITDLSHWSASNNRLLLLSAMVTDSGSVLSEIHWTHVDAKGLRTTYSPEVMQAPSVTLSAIAGEKYVCYAKDANGSVDSINVIH